VNIIGIAGRRDDLSSAGSGKDEVAKFLVRHHDYVIVSFADEIKRTAMRWYDIDPSLLWGPSELRETYIERLGCTVRHLLQQIGTEVGRNVYKNTWVDYTLRVATRIFESGYNYTREYGVNFTGRMSWSQPAGVVIPDVRWPAANEGQAIKSVGGKLWLVVRPGTNQKAPPKHASETQPVPDEVFDRIIQNDGTLEALEHAVGSAMALENGWKP